MTRAWAHVATFLAVLTLLGALVPAAEAASIAPAESTLGEPLVGASAAHLGGKVYVFGGRLEDGTYSSRILEYDTASGGVTTVATLPAPLGGPTVGGSAGRYSGAAVASGGKIYYFGGATLLSIDLNGDGTNENVPKASRDIIEFDPSTRSARILDDKLPTGAWGLAGIESSAGYVYLFGGFTFDPGDLAATKRHDRILRFAPQVNEGSAARVKELATFLPYAVQDAAVAKLGSRIYLMGGLSDHDPSANPCPTYTYYNAQSGKEETNQVTVCLTKRIVSFDAAPDAEIAIGVAGELPYRAQFVNAAVVNGKAYVPGGLLTDGSPSTSIVEVSVDAQLTPQARVLVPTLPKAAFGQAVASDGANVFVLGGRTGADDELTSDILRLDPRVTPPWAPRSATATDITGGVRLTWDAPSYNGDGVVSGYRIYRQPVGGEEERITETQLLSYDDTGVEPGVEYVWRISAVNAAGESNASARVSRSSGIAVPGAVAAFQAFAANDKVVLRWLAPEATGGSNITGYRILRNNALLTSLPPDATEYEDESAQNGETYQYQVRAYNAKGDGALSDSVRVTPAPVPPAPSGLSTEIVASESGDSVRLTWFAPPESVERYLVYRASLPGREGTLVGELTSTTYTDANVERGRTYYYTVAAENDAGRSPPSAETPVSLVSQPGAPGEVTALGLEGEIRVSWAPPVDTGDAPASSLRYYVSRSGGGSSRSIIVKTDIDGTVFVDRAVTPGQAYTYTVTTLNPMLSEPSAPATATAKAIQNKPPTAVLAILPPVTSAGDPVELDASQSGDIDGTIKSYLFDFGDGTDPVSTTSSTVTHQYAMNGTFTATVIVTDNRNDVSEPARAQVMVGEVITDRVEGALPGNPGSGTTSGAIRDPQPGSETPAIPGPGAALVLLGVAAMALAWRRR